jgi:F0F1-type ATP synthase assembly protein I
MSQRDEDPEKATATASSGLAGTYLGFLAMAAGIIALLFLVGLVPTRRLAGQLAVPAMTLGCLISLLAAMVGTLPVFLARGKKPADTVPTLLVSMGARLLTTLMLLVIAWTNAKLAPLMNTLVVWLLISHAALLVAEIRFTRRALYAG